MSDFALRAYPSLISLMVSVDVKHYVYLLTAESKIKTSAPVSLRANFSRGYPIRACALTSFVHFLAT